jgi:hypothetical protein
MTPRTCVAAMFSTAALLTTAAAVAAPSVFFSSGAPDGQMGTLSRQASGALVETETADDFLLGQAMHINQATFTGLLPLGTPLTGISNVEIEIYHLFPADSANPPSGNVPMRTGSPSDVEIASATRDGADGSLSFSAALLHASFSVANTVVNGIHPKPNQTTGGEGSATGEEVTITATFTTPIDLAAGHYFFRPEVLLPDGNFLWLSSPKPILAPNGTPFAGDLQSWIRNTALKPDWLRVGTDIVGPGPGPFNASFSLIGEPVPEPGTNALMLVGLAAVVGMGWAKRRKLI